MCCVFRATILFLLFANIENLFVGAPGPAAEERRPWVGKPTQYLCSIISALCSDKKCRIRGIFYLVARMASVGNTMPNVVNANNAPLLAGAPYPYP